jgi:two-component system, NarL family, response regulator DevR
MVYPVERALQIDARPTPASSRTLAAVPTPVTVFLADARELIHVGVRHLLEATAGLELVGATASLEEAYRAVVEGWADIVLIDADLDRTNGTTIARRLAEVTPAARFCFLVDDADPAVIAELSRLGASGFLHKRSAGRHLVDALDRLAADGLVMDPMMAEALMSSLLDPPARPQQDELSERDRELLRLLGEGRTNKEIAAAVFLSEKTVKNYLTRLFRTLGVRSRTEAALLGARLAGAAAVETR